MESEAPYSGRGEPLWKSAQAHISQPAHSNRSTSSPRTAAFGNQFRSTRLNLTCAKNGSRSRFQIGPWRRIPRHGTKLSDGSPSSCDLDRLSRLRSGQNSFEVLLEFANGD